MKKIFLTIFFLLFILLIGCAKKEKNVIINNRIDDIIVEDKIIDDNQEKDHKETKKELSLMIDDKQYEVYWSNNDSVNSLIESINDKLVIYLELGEFYQFGQIEINLPTNDLDNEIYVGDIILINGNIIALAYSQFNGICTKLGRINLRNNEIVDLLCEDNVIITLSINNNRG